MVCRDVEENDKMMTRFKEITIKDEVTGDIVPLFICPPHDSNRWKNFRSQLRTWLDSETEKVSYADKCHIRWWEQTRQTGLILPFSCVKIFNIDNYLLKRNKLSQFRNELTHHFSTINLCEKNKLLPFAPMWEQYCNELKKAKHRQNSKKMRQLVIDAAKADVNILLQSFIFHCLPLLMKKKNGCDHEHGDWMKSEYLYIFDDCCNTYNREKLYESHQQVFVLINIFQCEC